jgi:hypothetical protein
MWDILKWFLIIFFGIFLIWVFSGGPQRAEQKNLTPTISGPRNIGTPFYPEDTGNPRN